MPLEIDRNRMKPSSREGGEILAEDVDRAAPAGNENYSGIRVFAAFNRANANPRCKLQVACSEIGPARGKHFRRRKPGERIQRMGYISSISRPMSFPMRPMRNVTSANAA